MRTSLGQTLKRFGSLSASMLIFAQAMLFSLSFLVSGGTVAATQNQNPNDVPYWCATGVKFEGSKVNTGTHTINPVSITVVKNQQDKTVLSATAGTGVNITKIIIKGGSTGGNQGSGNNLYQPPFAYPMIAPNNNGGQLSDISHVIVCYEAPKGSIKIIKDAQPDSTQDFEFEIDQEGQGLKDDFKLDDDASLQNGSNTNSNSKTYSNLVADEYEITEDQESGWKLTDIRCTGGADVVTNVANRKVTINLAGGENVECTFVNQKNGTIKIVKEAQPRSTDDFSFTTTGSGLSNFTLDDDQGLQNGSSTHSNSRTFDSLAAGGTYTITETEKNGWTLDDIVCVGQGVTKDVANRKVTIVLAPSDSVTCTFINQKYGTITVYKQTNPVGHQAAFEANISGTGAVIGSTSKDFSTAAPAVFTAEFGTYSVTESELPDGWTMTGNTCKDLVINKDNLTASCTITNTKHGILKVNKHTTPDGDETEFPITAMGTSTIYGDTSRMIADGEYETYHVLPGTYSVSESATNGWVETSNTCKDVVVAAGETKACDIYNARKARVTIVKEAYGNYGEDESMTFDFTGDLGDFYLGDGDYATFKDLENGNYSVTEKETNGWKLDYVYCDNEYWKQIEGGVKVSVEAGDDITCTFYNYELGKIKGQKFEDLNGNNNWDKGEPALEGWTIELSEVCLAESDSRVSLSFLENIVWNEYEWCENEVIETDVTDQDGRYEFKGLDYGYYRVCEVQQSGWMQTFPWENEDGCHYVWINREDMVAKKRNFGNFELGTVNGFKFNDANGNATYDNVEEKLSGWTIKLSQCVYEDEPEIILYRSNDYVNKEETEDEDCVWTEIDTTLTDQNGNYSFGDLEKGEYRVCEVQKSGWTRMFPAKSDCHDFEITTSGDVVTANFGNKANQPGQVLGETLVNTGSSWLQGLFVGLSIIGLASGITYMSRKQTMGL